MSTMTKVENAIAEDTVLDYAGTLQQVQEEIRVSREYVRERRIAFRNRLKLYNNQRKQKSKIGDTSIYNVMNVMLAVYYMDQMQVKFKGREISDISQAANIENTAKFDYSEMGMDTLDYMAQWDRLFYGVGIRVMDQWDENRKVPLPKSMDALSWLPDPKGYQVMKHFRYMGFEVEYFKSEMTDESGFINLNQLDNLRSSSPESESELTRIAHDEALNLNSTEAQYLFNKSKGTDQAYDMVDLYTELQGKDGIKRKYLITVDDAVKEIFRCEEILPVTIEEEKNPALVPFPAALNYYSPSRHDPFGVSIPDLVEDKQRAKSILKNLRIAATKADLYPMYIYNRDKILNRRDLDFAFNKFIAVRGDANDSVVTPLNKAATKTDETLNNEQSLDRDIDVATGADQVTKGVLSDQQRTLGEVEQVTANANLRFLLGARINAWGERRFWKLWLRLYRQNLKDSDKKTIRLQSALGNKFSTILRKDFITAEDPDIEIGSKLELEQEQLRERNSFIRIYPLIVQDPTKPKASKRFAERHMLRLYGISADEIAVISPETPDEMRANMENELLNDNESVDVDVMKEDHLSHIVIHGQGEVTDQNQRHIQAHKTAYFESGQADEVRDLDRQVMLNANRAGQPANSNPAINNNTNNNQVPAGAGPMVTK